MFARLFRSLFAGGKGAKPAAEPVSYKGYQIYAEPKAEGGQYRLAGRICKEIDGELKTHHFIRSDLIASRDEAEQIMIRKAELFIDQTGIQMFK